MLVAVFLVAVLFFFIKTTKTGTAMRAISEDRVAAGLQGISINRISATAMCMGCGLAAIAGAVVGPIFAVSPTMGSFALMKGIGVIILGGLGSLAGAVCGGFIIGMIDGDRAALHLRIHGERHLVRDGHPDLAGSSSGDSGP